MAKRSAWAAQGESEVRRIAAAHSGSLLSNRGKYAFDVIHNKGIDALPVDALNDMVASNAAYLVEPMIELIRESTDPRAKETIRQHGKSGIKKMLRETTQIVPIAIKQHLCDIAARHVLENESKLVLDKLENRVISYLKERGLEIKGTEDKIDVVTAIRAHLFELDGAKSLAKGVNIRAIERLYLEIRKSTRTFRLEEATEINVYYKRICKGASFTKNQKDMIKRFVKKEIVNLNKKKASIFGLLLQGKVAFHEISDQHSKIETEFIESNRAQFLKQFKLLPKVATVTQKPNGQSTSTKLGTREERKSSHIAREKTPKQRTRDLDTLKTASKDSGVLFDAKAYCLSEIERENAQSGAVIRDMVNKGLINTGALSGLFASGSLTIKTFIHASQTPKFSELFGHVQLNVLAKGLSFIGPKGRPITRAKRAFQSTQSEQIFEFLKHNGFLETHHGGYKIVYLSRRENGNGHHLRTS
jgi:hypothetical protein